MSPQNGTPKDQISFEVKGNIKQWKFDTEATLLTTKGSGNIKTLGTLSGQSNIESFHITYKFQNKKNSAVFSKDTVINTYIYNKKRPLANLFFLKRIYFWDKQYQDNISVNFSYKDDQYESTFVKKFDVVINPEEQRSNYFLSCFWYLWYYIPRFSIFSF